MGAGRKTSTYDVDTKASAQYSYEQFQARQRNLGENLGGCIFGCTNDTMQECVTDLVFGLPKSHWCYVQWISKGMPIFLFNYSDRSLHGIYRAVTDGEWELKPEGWCRVPGSRTMYPAQVKVEVYAKCEALVDKEYRPILANSYAEDGHLVFELKKTEAQALCKAFDAKTSRLRGRSGGSVAAGRPMPSATGATSAVGKQQANQANAASSSKPNANSASTSRDLGSASSVASDTSGYKAAASSSAQQEEYPNLPSKPAPWAAATAAPSQKRDPWGEAKSEATPAPTAAAQPTPKPAAKAAAQSVAKAQEPAAQAAPAARPAPAPKAAPKTQPAPAPQQPKAEPAGWDKVAADEEEESWDNGASSSQWNSMDRSTPASSWHPGGLPEAPAEAPAAQPSKQVQTQENGHAPAANAGGRAPAEPQEDDDLYELLLRMHEALGSAANGTAGALFLETFTNIKSKLDQARADRILLAVAADQIKREKQQVEAIVSQQTTAIEVLKDECSALRRDLAFVGSHINIKVVDVNPLVASLPILSSVITPSAPQGGTSGLQAPTGSGVTADSILLFGGSNGKQPVHKSLVKTIAAYTPSTSSLRDLDNIPMERAPVAGAACAVGSSVYLMGGHVYVQSDNGGIRTEFLEGCLRYDIPTREWFEMNPMSGKRGSLAAVSLHGKVYAIGGGLRSEATSLVEVLDPEINIWMTAKSLKVPRFATSAGVVGESIYIVGGFDSEAKSYLRTMERFDPREGRWEAMPQMEFMRGGSSVVTVDNELYVLGGFCDTFLEKVEVFDTRKGKWRESRSMKTPHAYFASGYIDGRIYALSGMEGPKEYNTRVESYDPQLAGSMDDRWQIMSVNTSSNKENSEIRAFAAACQVHI